MTYDAKELAQYPEIMNKEQMRKVCHISKRTAHYLLQFTLDPPTSALEEKPAATPSRKKTSSIL